MRPSLRGEGVAARRCGSVRALLLELLQDGGASGIADAAGDEQRFEPRFFRLRSRVADAVAGAGVARGIVVRLRGPCDGDAGQAVGGEARAKFMRSTSAPVLTQVEDCQL